MKSANQPRVSLAITHFNRPDLIGDLLTPAVMSDPRIAEIAIVDDASDLDKWKSLVKFVESLLLAATVPVRLSRNKRNLDCYANKHEAVRLASNEWVILFDSDNILEPGYLDVVFGLPDWEDEVAYLPTFAKPYFDYRKFDGLRVTRNTVARFCSDQTFLTALNTANHFFQRDKYLHVWDPAANPHTADSIFMNYRWLEVGFALQFVPGMHYGHRVHSGSHYKQNVHKTGSFARTIEAKLRSL